MPTPSPLPWMIARLRARRSDYEDDAGCCLLTRLVEDFDAEVLTGSATLDPNHAAWDAAVTAAERVGGFND